MTPLELGLLGAGFLFFVAPLRGLTPRDIWAAALGTIFLSSFLALGGGNLFLLYWNPSGAHLNGVVGFFGTGNSPEYFPGFWAATHQGGDLKFILLFLFGVTGVIFLNGSPQVGEPILLTLVAVVAGLITFSVDNLVLLYLGLELQALCLYTLVGFFKFNEERTDAALRYLLSGSLVSGFILLGFARWYGQNGGFHLFEFTSWDSLGSAWVIGVIFFKLGVAPFHFWTPLVYTPLEWGTLGFNLGPAKVNLWYLLVGPLGGGAAISAWWPTWWAGLLSVGVGSIGGFFQTSLGGLLAYSGVINGGYLLLLSSSGQSFFYGYYLVTYLLGTALLVGLTSVWGSTRFEVEFSVWAKLGVGIPLLVYYLTLNLGGLPVFPGFFAKLALIQGLSGFGFFLLWGVIAASIIPAVYYVSIGALSLFEPSSVEVVQPSLTPSLVVSVLVVSFNGGITFLLINFL